MQRAQEIEQEYPGFLNENKKLTAVVWSLTGIRVIFGLFFLYISHIYQLESMQGWMNLIGSFFFLMWYSWMLRSGKGIAVLMLLFRGYGIVTGGAAVLSSSPWLPLPLIFTLVFALIMEFVEAVFCIYVLFNETAARTIRLNKEMDQYLLSNGVSQTTLETMAGYKNSYAEETDANVPDAEKLDDSQDESE